jgi:hypothetical protein
MYVRRSLIANPHVMEKYLGFVGHPGFVNTKISSYFGLLASFEGLYARYKPRYWWYDIFNIYTSIFLTSILSAILPSDFIRILVSIFILCVSYIIEGITAPYKYTLENAFSYYTNFQLLVLYLAMYIRVNETLGPTDSYYYKLDMFLVVLQVVTQLIAVVYLLIHFKNKHVDANPSVLPDAAGDRHVYDSIVGDCCLMDVNYELISNRDLLRVMSLLFLSLAPAETFSRLQRRLVDVGGTRQELFVQMSLPSVIVGKAGNGDLTVFAKDRFQDDSQRLLAYRGGHQEF